MKRVSALIATGKPAERRSPRRLIRGLMATLAIGPCILCTMLTLTASAARAEVPKLISYGSFAVNHLSLGVAVDQSTNDLFVSGLFDPSTFGPAHVSEFDASDNPLSSSFGEAFYSGVAVSLANGEVDVLGEAGFGGPTAIETYDPNSGELLSSFPVPRSGNLDGSFTAVQIATDSAGDVYVPNVPGNEVLEYSPTGTLLATFTGSGAHALSGPTGVAVDSSGDVWVADDGDDRIEEFDPTGAFLSTFESGGVRSLALDGQGHVLAIVENSTDGCGTLEPPCAHLVEYSSAGTQLADLGAGAIGLAEGRFTSMVAASNSSGRVYVTDGGKSRVLVFQTPLAPVLGQESVAEVGTSEAKLGALVNPGGIETTYRFEYDTREYREGEGPHGVNVPFPEGSAGEGFSSHRVWASAKGLAPGTTYHYRAITTNGVGTIVGPDETFTTKTVAQTACPNENTRGGFSAALPDCRAYELVTPATKASAQPDTGHTEHGLYNEGGAALNYAADDGNRFASLGLEVLSGSQSAGLEFISTRTANGWSTQDALPRQPYNGERCTLQPQIFVLHYSSDLSRGIILDHSTHSGFPGECLLEPVEVVSGEPAETENLLLSDNGDGSYQLIDLTPSGVTPTNASLVAASANLSVVVFSERAKLTPDALSNAVNLYEWHEGVVRLLQFTSPSEAPVAGELLRISADGSEMFFTAGGKLYVRLNGGERTVQIDEARGGSGPGGGGSFAAVTAAGSQVFFADDAAAGLTSNTVPGSGTNLYRYDMGTGQLSDLTPVSGADAAFADVGEDGSYVSFTSPTVLPGSQANQFGESAESGRENLYVDHDGAITFAMHGGGGVFSASGAFFAFESRASLTGYESRALPEVYVYGAESNRFECASCNPSGEAPATGVALASQTPGGAPHPVSNDGQVFFQTAEALLPGDTDGVTDIYEFDYYSGLHLLSTGTSAHGSYLLDASPSGDDVFFLTRQDLVPQDNAQEANKIYDTRVDGGFSEPTPPPACTTADACRAAAVPQPSIFGEPASQTFSGAGNFTAGETKPSAKPKSKPVKCRRRSAKRKGTCVKKSQRKARKSAHAKKGGK